MEPSSSASGPAPAPSELDEALRVEFLSRYLLVEGIEKCPIPLFVIDHDHVITKWNEALAKLTGINSEVMIGTREHWKVFYPFARPTMADLTVEGTVETKIDHLYSGKYKRSALHEGGYELLDFFPHLGEDGRWVQFMAAPLRDPSGRVIGAIETLQDVTDRHRTESELQENQSFLRQIVDGSSVPTFVIDREHRVTHWNRACEIITGVLARDIVGTRNQWRPFYADERPVMADLILINAVEKDVDLFYHGKFRASQVLTGAFEAEDYFPHLGESGKWLFFTAAPLRDSAGQFVGAIETLQDITLQKQAELSLRASEEKFRIMSITDALTSLYNARYFHEQIEIEIRRAVRYRRPLSLLMIDIDNFKQLNDTHGHPEGDRALALVSAAIRQSCREVDTAYRYGGEEFTVILPETELELAARLAERLRQQVTATPLCTEDGTSIGLTASFGVAELRPGDTAESLLRRADEGVYAAKRRGKNCCVAV
ncbi:MAG: diguanylate cyclase [Rhodocyclales bacterium]|nr:diguanylate cyclase [Rhodocyclales bacterium]